jgi:hypothetical protein
MRSPATASVGVALLAAVRCGGSAEPPASVMAVVPASAFNDAPVTVTIRGGPFRPAYAFDVAGGHTSIELGAFTAFLAPAPGAGVRIAADALAWRSSAELSARLPELLPAGAYDVEVRDPRGQVAVLNKGFTSLGPDTEAPTVTINQPVSGSLAAANTEIPVVLRADDGLGHLARLRWTVSSRSGPIAMDECQLPAGTPSQANCRFAFVAPTPDLVVDTLSIEAEVVDTAGNHGSAETQLWVGLHPRVVAMSPNAGPATGMTPLTIEGTNFIQQGTKVFVDGVPADPNGGTVETNQMMRASTPPHDPGVVRVSVRTGSVDIQAGFFEYVARPLVRAVEPTSGAGAGGVPVAVAGNHFRPDATRIYFGGGSSSARAELLCPRYISEHRIEGLLPPGVGLVSVFAIDPIAGGAELPTAFAYIADGDGDADGGAVSPSPSPSCATGDGGPP